MTYKPEQFRVERFRVQMSYDAAFLYWTVEGVMAERWAHGPIFGGYNKQVGADQVTLVPASTEGDDHLHATSSGLLSGGLNLTPEGF
jgi:hypothetical protein